MINGIVRGTFAAALSFAVAWLGFPSRGSTDTVLNVGKASSNASAIIPVNVGDKLGIFARHGA
jgi:hypothetical protein